MNLKTINGFLKTEEADAYAKSIEERASGAQLFASPAPQTTRPGYQAPRP